MNFLLDTHSFLWLVFDSSKLSKSAREVLENMENTIFLSSVSFWEISLKHSLGKLILENRLPTDLVDAAEKLKLDILNLSASEAASFYKLPKATHKDPFDRIIIWQAIYGKMTLITKDRHFEDYKKMGLKTIW